MSDYTFLGIKRSTNPNKKYMAVLRNKSTGREKLVHFGARSYEQYKDITPLRLYSSKDHLDSSRRRNYLSRHHHGVTNKAQALRETPKYTAKWFSTKYLW